MSDERVNVNGEVDAGWTSYWPPNKDNGETVAAPGDEHNGKVTTEGDPMSDNNGIKTERTDTDEQREWPPTPEQLTNIRQRLLNGESSAAVGDDFGISGGAVYMIAVGETYTEISREASIGPLDTEGTKRNGRYVRGNPVEDSAEDSELKDDSTPGVGGVTVEATTDPDDKPPEPEPVTESDETRGVPAWVVAVVAGVLGYLLGRWGGSDD